MPANRSYAHQLEFTVVTGNKTQEEEKMTGKLTNSIGFLLILLLSLMFHPIPCAHASDASSDLARIRKARDLIDARQYEAAHKILQAYLNHRNQDIQLKAKHRMAYLEMRRDRANPYYNLEWGCQDLFRAASYGDVPHAQWAYSQMLKKSPYLQTMPHLLAQQLYKWNLSAAEKGFAPSQQELGMVLSAGTGPETDYVRAYMWLKLACDRYTNAPLKVRPRAHRRRALARTQMALLKRNHLSPKQIKNAIKMARKWKKNHPNAYQFWPVEDQDY